MPSTSSRKSKRSDYTAASSIASRRRHHRTTTRSNTKYTDCDDASKQKHSSTKNRLLNGAVCILAFCLISTANFQSFLNDNNNYYLRRRFLLGPPKLSEDQISKSKSHHLFPVDYMPNGRAHTVAYFDHADASPYKDILSLYQCLAEDIAVHSRYGVEHTARFQLYENERKTTLDMPTFRQAMSAHDGLLILTDEPYETVNQLFDRQHRGRMFALFTNPVYRTAQQFMNQKGEKSTSLLNWITTADDNVYIKKILGKQPTEPVTLVDLQMAKEFVRQSVIVGLSSEMKESFNRFNVALGVGEGEMKGNAKCLEEIFRNNDAEIDKFVKMVRPNSREWNAIVQRNYLDMALYTYMEKLFEEYDGVFNFFPQDEEDDLDAAEEVAIGPPNEEEPTSEADSIEEQPATQESSEEREARIMKDSPYAGADEATPVESEESPVIQNDSTDPKAALKRRLADVSSFEFGSDKAATPFFWHVPKAGGTAIQNLYWCMGLTLANEVGGNPKLLQRKNVPSDKLTVFQPWKNSGNIAKVINVDVTTHKGIANAIQLGFLTQEGQPKTDFVSSSLFHVVSMKLFSKEKKARMFALFRHPVERAVSKFYYLSKASWEPTYDETWANMTLEEWATNDRGENNWLVHHLAGKKHYEVVDRNDLEMAKEMIKSKFIIGMMNEFDESVHRFNLLLGVDEKDSTNKQCMADFSQTDDSKSQKKEFSNRNSYTKAQEGSKAWNMIAEINSLDVELFSFIEEQFEAQKHLFEQYEAQRIIFDQLQAQQNVKTG